MAIFIGIWLSFGLLAVGIAVRKKGRLRTWLVVGALLGPFALMAAIVVPPPDPDWAAGGLDGGTLGGAGGGGGFGCGGGG